MVFDGWYHLKTVLFWFFFNIFFILYINRAPISVMMLSLLNFSFLIICFQYVALGDVSFKIYLVKKWFDLSL